MKANGAHQYSNEELRSLQMVLLEMLLEIDRVCRKNNITYCIFMGTMLGAVRHGGFIPWDDDVDVAMMRPEYEKFKEACKLDLDQSRFFYQDHETDPHHPWGYARMRRRDSEFVRVGQEHMKMRTGIVLDIFPMDSTPDFAPLRAVHCFYCFVLRKLLYAEAGRVAAGTSGIRAWYAFLNLIPRRWVFNRIKQLSMRQRKTKLVRILAFPTPRGRPFGYPRLWLERPEEIQFENSIVFGIKDPDSFLKFSYGDYMRLPPPDQRRCTHPAAKFRLPSDIDGRRQELNSRRPQQS
ncbi:phosphorylcholine transferase LicD [Bradyrhizobium sp. SZCCHNRI20481]|uniref:LicD family protein n=1 Tax=Bradyrhizobium sp. SZCCHNRI20481 TaxID=3057286 RepID=UPI00291670B5|nr:LicD family protein [Bradyrhizobium sp. SZCCHNRI20481]